MEMERSVVLIALIIALGASLTQQSSDTYEYGYDLGTDKGPEHWGVLNPKWAICNNGLTQSPIDLPKLKLQLVPNSERVVFSYDSGDAILKNRGHDIEVRWPNGAGKIKINGMKYVLKQLHWHTPSEHTISGTRYAMEMHMVHQNPNNETAVFGILFQLGAPDPFLSKLMDKIRMVSKVATKAVKVGDLNPREVICGRGTSYYRYRGSFTTPPCTEGVIWTVDTKEGTVSQEQIDLLQQAVEHHAIHNARPTQPLKGRKVDLYCLPNRKIGEQQIQV